MGDSLNVEPVEWQVVADDEVGEEQQLPAEFTGEPAPACEVALYCAVVVVVVVDVTAATAAAAATKQG